MPIREDILVPIPGENPSGVDLRYDTNCLRQNQGGPASGRRTGPGRLAKRTQDRQLAPGPQAHPGNPGHQIERSADWRLPDRGPAADGAVPGPSPGTRSHQQPGHRVLGYGLPGHRSVRSGDPRGARRAPGLDQPAARPSHPLHAHQQRGTLLHQLTRTPASSATKTRSRPTRTARPAAS